MQLTIKRKANICTKDRCGNIADCVAAQIFEHMGRTAKPILNTYWSDLYQDAMFLSQACIEQLTKINDVQTLTIYWGVRDCGTHMCIDSPLLPVGMPNVQTHLQSWRFTFGKFTMFRYTVTKDDLGAFFLTTDEIEVETA